MNVTRDVRKMPIISCKPVREYKASLEALSGAGNLDWPFLRRPRAPVGTPVGLTAPLGSFPSAAASSVQLFGTSPAAAASAGLLILILTSGSSALESLPVAACPCRSFPRVLGNAASPLPPSPQLPLIPFHPLADTVGRECALLLTLKRSSYCVAAPTGLRSEGCTFVGTQKRAKNQKQNNTSKFQ